MRSKILIIAGPTAAGKTKYAAALAKTLNGEILSADSMQIYKYMDIGSAKPSLEELSTVPHHLIGEADPMDEWSAALYQREAKQRINQILLRGKLPVVVGGTGLYINSLLYEMDFADSGANEDLRKELQYLAENKGGQALHDRLKKADPSSAERIHPNNVKRLIRAIEVAENGKKGIPPLSGSLEKNRDYDPVLIGLGLKREVLYDRIEKRVDAMMDAGLLDEVSGLLERGLTKDHNSMKGIGYKEIAGFINGEYGIDEAVKQIKQNTRNYAKRQITWFRRYEDMKWFDLTNVDFDQSLTEITEYIRSKLYTHSEQGG